MSVVEVEGAAKTKPDDIVAPTGFSGPIRKFNS